MPRLLALLLAYFFLALAVIGVVLPGLPTVPFLLLAAWFSARGSERLHRWLYAHPVFGKLLTDWETQQAISRKTKILAVAMMLVSWVILMLRVDNLWVVVGTGVLLSGVAAYVISRPEPR